MASFSNLGFDDPKTRAAMRGANQENFNTFFSSHAMREPKRMIYIHTVARKSTITTRILFPRLYLRGCESGERYVTCCSVPDPITQGRPDQENGGVRLDEHDGWRAVIDLLNPRNFSRDPFLGSKNPDFFANRAGTNLIAEGFWPSLHEKPPEDEIKVAERNRDAHYRWLTKEATRLAAVSTKDLNEFLQTYPDTHIAMDGLGLSATWHTLNVVRQSCPNCGDEIKANVAFHRSSVTEKLCVINPKEAYKAKAITKEEYEELTGLDENDSVQVKRGPGRPPKNQ
jgi:hypothetical protein